MSIVVRELAPHVVELRLDRPERMNALSVAMVEAMAEALDGIAAGKARMLVVSASGRAFCAGADLKERREMDAVRRLAHNAGINAAINAVAALPMPTLAAINGAALGGGCELALACDLRIAAEQASIGLTESRIGVYPAAGGTQRLPRLVGASRALELMFTAEPVSGRRAAEIGLVNEAVTAERLNERVRELATLVASRSPNSLRTIKRLVTAGTALPLADGLALERAALPEVFASADYAEGLAAFAEKRPPRFG
ncbi:MAG TPA: enoyl-CoA hydratase-related protein [Geminicoccaceae bacterium]|nr:enoyl-CoA hydratase-related protein [Geminicoccus sp.]HMU49313.1 enoyl-CoA hydratase-related protein [Geminicoccaceae bacterium]